MNLIKWLLGVGLALTVVTPAFAQPAKRPAGAAKKRAPKGKQAAEVAAAVAALASADVEVAARAAETLGTSETPTAHEALLDALALGLAPSVAVPALGALAMHPVATDVVALVRYAGHHNPTVRGAAITALARYADPAARAAVVAGLHDPAGHVRNTAAAAAARGGVREAIESMLLLLAKGEESSARALAQLGDPELARTLADRLGKVPDAALALCLGNMLKRADFGPDPVRVEVVRTIGKIQDTSAINALTEYLDSVPKSPKRPSRDEAEGIVNARLGAS